MVSSVGPGGRQIWCSAGRGRRGGGGVLVAAFCAPAPPSWRCALRHRHGVEEPVQELVVAVHVLEGSVFFVGFDFVCVLSPLSAVAKVGPAVPGMCSRPMFWNRTLVPVRGGGHTCGIQSLRWQRRLQGASLLELLRG